MKKRVLSLILATSMLIVSSTAAFAAQPLSVDSAKEYLNSAKEYAEEIIDEFKADVADEDLFDNSLHIEQRDILSDAVKAFKNIVNDTTLSYINAEERLDLTDAIDLLCAELLCTTEQKLYFYSLVKAESNNNYENAVKAYSTAGMGLKESFEYLDGNMGAYAEGLGECFVNENPSSIGDPENYIATAYNAVATDARKYIAEPLVEILKIVSTTDEEELKENYNAFLENDRAKKTVAVLLGLDLAREVFLEWENDGEQTKGILRRVKAYINENPDKAISEIKDAAGTIMVADIQDAADAAFDLFGTMVNKAYKNVALKEKVLKLTGDGIDPGLIENLVNSMRSDLKSHALNAINIGFNIFLSEFVQIKLAGDRPLNTISAKGAAPVEISDNTSVNFKLDNIPDVILEKIPDRFDNVINAPVPKGWFDVVCYVGGDKISECEVSNYVTYSDGKISVTRDNTKDSRYNAFLVLYRKEANGVSTFIESYPVLIENYTTSPGGGGATRYLVKFETNGGETLGSAYYVKGSTVQLTKVPVREGYIFDGWYLDAALTQKVESVVMNGNITVYAKWTKDGSAVVSTVDIPEILEGEHHYAYIMGYPDGDIRPMGNVTRAETVTMIFRLLKGSVRTANIKYDNSFSDVDEDDWYNTAVSTLAGLGIIEGRTETEFMPDAYITRAEFATLFARLAQFDVVAENKYGDVDNHWAEEHIHEASAYGWIAGYEDDTFRPDKAINRAEAMTLINRVLKRVPQSKDDLLDGMTIWTDNKDTSAWYYLAVQEATNSHDYERKNKSYETWTKLTENRDWTTYEE